MEGSQTKLTLKKVKPVESRGKECLWKGNNYVSEFHRFECQGLPVYQPLNPEPEAYEWIRGLDPGASYWHFKGSVVEHCHVRMHGWIYVDYPVEALLASFEGITIRIVLYYKPKPRFGILEDTWSDMFASTLKEGFTESDIMSDKNFEVKEEFEVLYDNFVRVPPYWSTNPSGTMPAVNQILNVNDKGIRIDTIIDMEGRRQIYEVQNGSGGCDYGFIKMFAVSDDTNLEIRPIWNFDCRLDFYFNTGNDVSSEGK